MQSANLIEYRYGVFQLIGAEAKRVGIVMARNYTHANTKAMQLFNRHVWVERLT